MKNTFLTYELAYLELAKNILHCRLKSSTHLLAPLLIKIPGSGGRARLHLYMSVAGVTFKSLYHFC